MPAPVMLTDAGAGARASSSTWLTLADFKKHVFSPGYVVEDDCGIPARGTKPSGRPISGATAVLFNFFAQQLRRKRLRSTGTPAGCAGGDGTAGDVPGERRQSNSVRPSCCSATLRNAVLDVLHTAHGSIGSAEAVGHGGCVVVVHLTAANEDAGCPSSPKRDKRAAVWYLDGVCVAEEIPQAYRAVWTNPCISSEPRGGLTDGTTTVSATFSACSASFHQPSVKEGPPLMEVTYLGDIFRMSTPLCGVRLMWVSPSSRGRGVAYSMVERARRAVCYGFVVPAEHVAFSEPTAMGRAFARRYHARDDFAVYGY
ncbi:hypothetical protein LSCM1_06377 [Leishmania martiniquensis]|uniref:N-acetyltransferase ESCO acetyl-transferase domain-containing protein n=1 Tax=Leishmania martiniquensis TaxID=1580590 RepID=A0A836HEL6_9TRYP|nr:hypothetical protein LSCM1_06377 [Leishmania martiniquensis]